MKKPIKIIGRVGNKQIPRYVYNQTANVPEQINPLKTDIRKAFERLGYDTANIEYEIL